MNERGRGREGVREFNATKFIGACTYRRRTPTAGKPSTAAYSSIQQHNNIPFAIGNKGVLQKEYGQTDCSTAVAFGSCGPSKKKREGMREINLPGMEWSDNIFHSFMALRTNLNVEWSLGMHSGGGLREKRGERPKAISLYNSLPWTRRKKYA